MGWLIRSAVWITRLVLGCLVGLFLVLAAVMTFSQKPNPSGARESLIAAGILAAMYGIVSLIRFRKKCSVCQAVIDDESYRWKLEGRRMLLCPTCNIVAESKKRAEAWASLDKK